MYMESKNAKEELAVCYILRVTSPVREQIWTSGKNYYRPLVRLVLMQFWSLSQQAQAVRRFQTTFSRFPYLQLVYFMFVLTTGPKTLFSLYVYTKDTTLVL